MTIDVSGVIRRRAVEESLASAAVLTDQAAQLEVVRARLVACLDSVRWRAGAAEACRTQGDALLRQLREARDDCLLAARLLRGLRPGDQP